MGGDGADEAPCVLEDNGNNRNNRKNRKNGRLCATTSL